MKVSLIQQSCSHDKAANFKKTEGFIHQAAKDGADLIVLQELHSTLYFCQTEAVENFQAAESIPGETTQFLGKLAKKYNIVIVGSVFERRAAGIYHNTAVVFDGKEEPVGMYRKMHIPDDPAFQEKFYFTPGDLGFSPIKTRFGSLGVLVCWDQWFPEAARLMALAGADMLIYPTAIGWNPADPIDEKKRQLDSWSIIQQSHAIANGIPVIACNRTGFEEDPTNKTTGIEFWGNSFIAGPQGEIIANNTDSDFEGVVAANIDLQKSELVRQIWPFFRDRRIDAYQGLLNRFNE